MTQNIQKDPPTSAITVYARIMTNEKFRDELANLLPPESKLSIDKFCAVMASYLKNESSLAQVSVDILTKCVMDAARFGVLPGGSEPGCYFTRFQDSRSIEMHLSYMGIREIVYRTGLVKDIMAMKICDGDEFSIDPTFFEKPITHKMSLDRDPNKIRGYYVVLRLNDNTQRAEFCNDKEANLIKSKRSNSSAWRNNMEGMIYKTLLRRALKHMCKTGDSLSFEHLKDALKEEEIIETTSEPTENKVDPKKDGAFADIMSTLKVEEEDEKEEKIAKKKLKKDGETIPPLILDKETPYLPLRLIDEEDGGEIIEDLLEEGTKQ